MKAQILTLVLAVILGMGSVRAGVYSSSDSLVVKEDNYHCIINQEEDGMVYFHMWKIPGEVVTIELFDTDGYTLYERKVKKESRIKIAYDFSQVPDGDYYIKVNVNREDIFTRKITNATSLTAN